MYDTLVKHCIHHSAQRPCTQHSVWLHVKTSQPVHIFTVTVFCVTDVLTFSFYWRMFTSSLGVEQHRTVALSLSFCAALEAESLHFNLQCAGAQSQSHRKRGSPHCTAVTWHTFRCRSFFLILDTLNVQYVHVSRQKCEFCQFKCKSKRVDLYVLTFNLGL